jgi:hypothetical protein
MIMTNDASKRFGGKMARRQVRIVLTAQRASRFAEWTAEALGFSTGKLLHDEKPCVRSAFADLELNAASAARAVTEVLGPFVVGIDPGVRVATSEMDAEEFALRTATGGVGVRRRRGRDFQVEMLTSHNSNKVFDGIKRSRRAMPSGIPDGVAVRLATLTAPVRSHQSYFAFVGHVSAGKVSDPHVRRQAPSNAVPVATTLTLAPVLTADGA